jgi:hypothetical protein
MSEAQLELLALLASAQTVGARRALALACRDGKLNDGRKLEQHWASLSEARKKYEAERDSFIKRYGSGSV